jgi:hypothetical protein
MESKRDLKRTKKVKDDSLLYIIRRAVEKLEMGTWEDTKVVYNYLATKERSKDGLNSSYRLLLKDQLGIKAVEKEIKKDKWVKTTIKVESLLQRGVPSVR